MDTLAAFYFSGTGNTRYATRRLCEKLSSQWNTAVYDICAQTDFAPLIRQADTVLLAFPIYGSSPPIPMRQFLFRYKSLWAGKSAIVLVTQYMFSGDGAASLGRTLETFGAHVRFAEHINMPNNLADCKMFKIRNADLLIKPLRKADRKIDAFAANILRGHSVRRGFSPIAHAVGYFCQRKWWRKGESQKRNLLKIAPHCTGCGACVHSCPVGNIQPENGKAHALGHCTLCYRCVNLCPQKAITLFGTQPPQEQYKRWRKSCFPQKAKRRTMPPRKQVKNCLTRWRKVWACMWRNKRKSLERTKRKK